MNEAQARTAAALLAAGAIRDFGLEAILRRYPDRDDARAVQEAMLSADAHLEWSHSWSPRVARTVRVVAVVGSPMIVIVLAVLKVAWYIDRLKAAWISGYRDGRRGR